LHLIVIVFPIQDKIALNFKYYKLRVRTECGKVCKHFSHFPAWISLEKTFFGLLVWKKKIIFQTWSFDMHN